MNRTLMNLIFLLSLVFLSGCSAKSPYKYVEINECMIPVPSNMELTEKTSQYSYSFSTPIPKYLKNFNPKSLDVHTTDYTSLKELFEKFKEKDYPLKFIKKIKKDKFTIIQSSFLEWDYNYQIYIGKTLIQLLNSSEEEMHYLVDYCQKTRKQETK